MKTVYTICIHIPTTFGTVTRRTMYFGTIKARAAVIEAARAKGYNISTNIEHVYTEAEGLKSLQIEETFARMNYVA